MEVETVNLLELGANRRRTGSECRVQHVVRLSRMSLACSYDEIV